MNLDQALHSSFRDPSGFVFQQNGSLYRQVDLSYREDYDHLMRSGLYEILTSSALLISHKEATLEGPNPARAYKIIMPDLVPFISYPYEWSFSQLRDAALTMLEIQKKSLSHGMSLKDSSAYNIQFKDGKPILIDTLSFEKYQEGRPWTAYRQFCQHFLAPLALMSYRDLRLGQLLRIHLDGIPLDLASRLLPFRTYFKFSLFCHIHVHAQSQRRFAGRPVNHSGGSVSRLSFAALIDSLESAVKKLRCRTRESVWANYYNETSYSSEALESKKRIVSGFLDKIRPANVWDLGANVGLFSRIATQKGIPTVSFDMDPLAVEKNYLDCVKKGETRLLPLLVDLTNPSPAAGWENRERLSLQDRGPVDCVFALALLHHLAISNNLPFEKIASYFSSMCNWLVIEYVPKSDSQAQRLLSARKDIFPNYRQEFFERIFQNYFTIITKTHQK